MTYRDIEELQMLLDKDIRGVINKGEIMPKDYQCLDVAVDITKDLFEIARMIPLMEEGVNGESYDTNPNWNRNNSYDSYPRVRGNRGYRSGDTKHMDIEEKLDMMMQNATTEQERQTISKIMREMEAM